jgi:chromosome segregation ATPase
MEFNKITPYKIKKITDLFIQRLTKLVKANAILINEKKELELKQIEITKEIDLTVKKHNTVEQNLQKELKKYKEQNSSEFNNKINELVASKEELLITIQQLKSNNKEIQSKLTKINSEKENFLQKIQEFEIEIIKLKKDNTNKQETIAEFNNKILNFESETTISKKTIEDCEKLKEELEEKKLKINKRNELLTFFDEQIILLENSLQ